MKSHPSHFRRNLTFLCRITLAVFLLIVLAGCSNGADADQPEIEAEIEQLTAENEKLHTDLDDAISGLKAAEDRVKELERELEAMQEAQAAPAPSEPVKVEITPREITASESLVGSWYSQEFYEACAANYFQDYTIGLVFNSDGTGTQNQILYLASDVTADNYATSDPRGEIPYPFTWSLDGDIVHTVFGSDGFIDYKFLSEQQKLLVTNQNGESFEDVEVAYLRDATNIPDGYVAKSVIVGDIQAKEASLRRKFLGTWYFDITTWTFNEDGTGVLDIPDVANQPAEQREFTYSVTETAGDWLLLNIDWEGQGSAFYEAKTSKDGSITLGDDLKLTRQFDATNCPLSTQMIQTGLDVFTGRMFYDMLGIEE